MGHLNPETLARLVDEPAGPDETEHLATCDRCAGELEALRRQRRALADLPDPELPPGDWEALEERLVREGLIGPPSPARSGSWWSPAGQLGARWLAGSGWLQAAAAVVLFLGGVGAGVAGANAADAGFAGDDATTVTRVASVDEAADVLQQAEDRYVSALLRYRELAGDDAGSDGDAASRYAALEALLAASQAAVRRAPTDPFINGVLVSTLAERQATLRQISTSDADNWF